jgi:cellulose biosynthesis protein BcsQ
MVDRRKRLHRELSESLRAGHPEVLQAAIPASAEVERMGAERNVVASFAPRGRAASAYEWLWLEVRARLSISLPRP